MIVRLLVGIALQEMVGPSVEGNKSNTGPSALPGEIPLSDLLDLEIQWSAKEENFKTGISDEKSAGSKYSMNLAGVDLDGYFTKGGGETVSAVSEDQAGTGNNYFQGHGSLSLFDNNDGPGNGPSQDHDNLSLFKNNDDKGIRPFQGNENLRLFEKPSETAARSVQDKVDDRFSDWEPDFQSTSPQKLRSVDTLVDSSCDVSAHMDTVFGSGKDISDGKPEVSTTASVSNTNEWFQGDFFQNKSNLRVTPHDQQIDETIDVAIDENDDSFDSWNDFTSSASAKDHSSSLAQSTVTLKPEKLEGTVNIKDGERVDNANTSSSINIDWVQDDQWRISSKRTHENKAKDQDYDSFDDWNGFTSSSGAQIPPGSSGEVANHTVPSEMGARPREEKNNDSFSGWDMDFQSTGRLPWESKSSNILADSSITSSAHMGTISMSEKDLSNGKPGDSIITPMSNANLWLQDDLWGKNNSMVTQHAQQTDVTIDVKDVKKIENASISSMNVDLTQDDLWQNSINKVYDKKTTEEDDDSFDTWNDFTSSASVKDASSGSFTQGGLTAQSEKSERTLNIEDGGRFENATNSSSKGVDWMKDDHWRNSNTKAPDNKNGDQEDDSFDAWNNFTSSVGAQATSSSLEWPASLAVPSVKQTSDVNFFHAANRPKNDFGVLMNPDLFSTDFSNQNSSIELKDGKFESSATNRYAWVTYFVVKLNPVT